MAFLHISADSLANEATSSRVQEVVGRLRAVLPARFNPVNYETTRVCRTTSHDVVFSPMVRVLTCAWLIGRSFGGGLNTDSELAADLGDALLKSS